MRPLTRIATMCGAAICGGTTSTQPAGAELPLGRAMARAAGTLAGIIRADARRISRARSSGAVIARRSRGTRQLRVYYRAGPPTHRPWYGAYELKLRTTRRFLDAVTISYFPTAASWGYGAPAQGEGPSYSFRLLAPGHHRGWRFSAADSFLGCGAQRPAPGQCEGLSQALGFDEAQGGKREFEALFKQAILVVEKAERHAPISGENLFSATPHRR